MAGLLFTLQLASGNFCSTDTAFPVAAIATAPCVELFLLMSEVLVADIVLQSARRFSFIPDGLR